MAFDLDDDELKATRKLNGSDKHSDVEDILIELHQVGPEVLNTESKKLYEEMGQ